MEDSPILGLNFSSEWSGVDSSTKDKYLVKYLECDEIVSPMLDPDDMPTFGSFRSTTYSKPSSFSENAPPPALPTTAHSGTSSNPMWEPSESEASPFSKTPTLVIRGRADDTLTPVSMKGSCGFGVDDEGENDFDDEEDIMIENEFSDEEESEDRDNEGDLSEIDDSEGQSLFDPEIRTHDHDEQEEEDIFDDSYHLATSRFLHSPRKPKSRPKNRAPFVSPQQVSQYILEKEAEKENVISMDLLRLNRLWSKNEGMRDNIFKLNPRYTGSVRADLFTYITRLHYELALRMGTKFGDYNGSSKVDQNSMYKEFAAERTLFLTYHLMDFFFSTKHNLGVEYDRIICLTILYIASKFEDVNIDVAVFRSMLNQEGYKNHILRQMEFAMLFSLNKFDLVHATIFDYVNLRITDWKDKKIREVQLQTRPFPPPQRIGSLKRKGKRSSNNNASFPSTLDHPTHLQPGPPSTCNRYNLLNNVDQPLGESGAAKIKSLEETAERLEPICFFLLNVVVLELWYLSLCPRSLSDLIFRVGMFHLHNKKLPSISNLSNENERKAYCWILASLKKEKRRRSFISRKYGTKSCRIAKLIFSDSLLS